jgi:PAS domain S-box-containing protein
MNGRTPYWLIDEAGKRTWLLHCIIGATYVLAGRVGLVDANLHDHVTLFWPPLGIALAAALIFGLRVLPAVAVGAFLAHRIAGAPLGFAAATAAGNAIEILVVVTVLRTWCGFDNGLRRVRDVLLFLGLGVGVAPLVGATIGVVGLCIQGMAPWADFVKVWRIWLVADAMGILLVTPVLLTWSQRSREVVVRRHALEAITLVVLLALVSHVVYGGLLDERLSRPLSLACFPFVIWGALRFGQRGAAASAMLAVTIAIVDTIQGQGPFTHMSPSLSLVYLYGFTGVATVTGLLLGAVVTEYRTVACELQEARGLLEARIADRTAALQQQLVERERVSAALSDSEERYRRITQAITDYIYSVSFVDGHPVRTTHAPTCEAVTGYTSEELAATPFLWLHMVHEDDRERVLGLTPEILATQGSVHIEHRIIRKDGIVRWVRNTTVPTFDANGVIVSYDGLIQDITDRKVAEEAVRESEAKFRAVFDSAGIGIAITALDGTLLECNPALERMLGYERGELQGKSSGRIAHPDDFALQRDHIRRILAGAQTKGFSTERRYVRKDGRILWGRITATLVRDAVGNPQYGLGLVEDITERKTSEQERERLLSEVQEAMANVKTLSGFVPICSSCKKIRDDRGFWIQVEQYLSIHSGVQFSHGICPECLKNIYPEYAEGYAAEAFPSGTVHVTRGGGGGEGSAKG